MLRMHLYATLRAIAGRKTLDLAPSGEATVRELLSLAIAAHPTLEPELFDPNGTLRPHTNVLLNGRNIRYLQGGLDARVTALDKLDVFPAVAGG